MPLGKKQKIFNIDKATINVKPECDETEAPEYPPEVNIKKAEGGYIIRKMGGNLNYHSDECVAENIESAMKKAKEHIG